MRRPQVLLVAALSAATVFVAGCGEDPSTQPTPTPPATEEPTASATASTEVFFSRDDATDDCSQVFGRVRDVGADEQLAATLSALVAGPTAAEMTAGYGGWFTAATADVVLSVSQVADVAIVDFVADLPQRIPNASTSCGSTALLAQLDETLLQFPDVTSARYSLAGDEQAFWEWLQREVP